MQDFIEQTIREAGKIALNYFKKGVSISATKADPDDVVSIADEELSKFFKVIQDHCSDSCEQIMKLIRRQISEADERHGHAAMFCW